MMHSCLEVAKFDMTREPDMTNPFINRSWVEIKRVRVIFRLTQLTRLLNGSCLCLTCLTRLDRFAYKVNFTILPLQPRYIRLDISHPLRTIPHASLKSQSHVSSFLSSILTLSPTLLLLLKTPTAPLSSTLHYRYRITD